MAAQDGNPSVQFLRLRVTDLLATGAPVTGAAHGFVSDQMIELTDAPEIESGIEILQRTGAGELCLDYKEPNLVKRRNLTLTICGVQDELIGLLTDALLIASAGTTIGHADPVLGTIPNADGVAIEGWSKNLVGGAPDVTYPYFRWLYPRTYGWTRGEDRLLNDRLAWTFNGIAIGNAGMRATGPFADWTDAASVARVRSVYRTASALPAASNSLIAVP